MRFEKKKKNAGLNRFYYLLYMRYNNSCTASVILYDVVFLFRLWRYIVSRFESSWNTWSPFRNASTSVDGETIINIERKATSFDTGHVLSTVNFLNRNRFVVFLIFLSFAHDHCWPLHFNLDPSLPLTYPLTPTLPSSSQNNFFPRTLGYLHIAARSR